MRTGIVLLIIFVAGIQLCCLAYLFDGDWNKAGKMTAIMTTAGLFLGHVSAWLS